MTGEMRFLREMLRRKGGTLDRDSADSEWIISIRGLLEKHFKKSAGEQQSLSLSVIAQTHHAVKKENLLKPDKKIELDGKNDDSEEFDDEFADLFPDDQNNRHSTLPKLNAKKEWVNTASLPSSLKTRPTRNPLSEINSLLTHLPLLKSPGIPSASSSSSSFSTAISSFCTTSKPYSSSFVQRSRHLVGDPDQGEKVFHLSDFVRDVGNRLDDEFPEVDVDIDTDTVNPCESGFNDIAKETELRSDASLVSDEIIIALLSPLTDAHSIPTLDDLALHLDKLTERVKIHTDMGVGADDRNSVVRGIMLEITGVSGILNAKFEVSETKYCC